MHGTSDDGLVSAAHIGRVGHRVGRPLRPVTPVIGSDARAAAPPGPQPPSDSGNPPTKPDRVRVPNVIGQDKDEAKNALQEQGFQVSIIEVDGSGQKDTVISTVPKAGIQVQPGSAITLRVSKGQATQVPNVVGQTLANAVQTLSSAGYTNLAVQAHGTRTASSSTRSPPKAPTPTSGSS